MAGVLRRNIFVKFSQMQRIQQIQRGEQILDTVNINHFVIESDNSIE